jgi:hypothetical protein
MSGRERQSAPAAGGTLASTAVDAITRGADADIVVEAPALP